MELRVTGFSWSDIFDLLSGSHQGVNDHPHTQHCRSMQDSPAPGTVLFRVLIGLVIGKPEKSYAADKKHPAIFGKPHGHGKASQAETCQDKGKLSAKSISKSRGNSPATGKFFFHSGFLNGLCSCSCLGYRLLGTVPANSLQVFSLQPDK